jgi:hypothetical protein
MFRWKEIQRRFIKVEEEVARMDEFRRLDEFAVMYQPWSTNLSVIIRSRSHADDNCAAQSKIVIKYSILWQIILKQLLYLFLAHS